MYFCGLYGYWVLPAVRKHTYGARRRYSLQPLLLAACTLLFASRHPTRHTSAPLPVPVRVSYLSMALFRGMQVRVLVEYEYSVILRTVPVRVLVLYRYNTAVSGNLLINLCAYQFPGRSPFDGIYQGTHIFFLTFRLSRTPHLITNLL